MKKFTSKVFKNSNPVRTIAYTIVCMALLNASYYTIKIIKSLPKHPGVVASKAPRFTGIKSLIRQQASVGYLSDHKPGSVEEGASHFQAQYHLAPIIVKKNAEATFQVGDFTSPPSPKAIRQIEEERQLQLVKNYHNGLLLFRKVIH